MLYMLLEMAIASCIVSYGTDVYILSLFVANKCEGKVYMRQGRVNAKTGILYQDVSQMAEMLARNIC